MLIDAHLPRNDVAAAVAISLAVTGGDDSWVWRPSPVASIWYVGAWGFPMTAEYFRDGGSFPTLRQQAGQIVNYATRADRPWEWSTIHPAEALLRYGTEARDATDNPQGYVNSGTDVSTGSVPAANALRGTLVDVRLTMQQAGKFMRNLWDTIKT